MAFAFVSDLFIFNWFHISLTLFFYHCPHCHPGHYHHVHLSGHIDHDQPRGSFLLGLKSDGRRSCSIRCASYLSVFSLSVIRRAFCFRLHYCHHISHPGQWSLSNVHVILDILFILSIFSACLVADGDAPLGASYLSVSLNGWPTSNTATTHEYIFD